VDGAGNVYIADTSDGALKEYHASTQQVSTLVFSALIAPVGVAVDGAGNVFFADFSNNAIKELVASTGQDVTLISSGLPFPWGVAVDGAGNVFFAVQDDNAIKELVASTGQVVTLVSSGLSDPTGVAVDGAGNVFIADSLNNAIKEYNTATGQLSTLVSSGLNNPSGVAVDGAGNVFIPDTGHSAIKEMPRAFVSTAPLSEPSGSGSDQLLPVLPFSQALTGPFAPQSDQSWLSITSVANGVIHFSFSANTAAAARMAHISVLGQQITVTQAGLPTSAISFPASNGAYSAAGWSGSIRGTAADHSASGIKQVQLSIRQASTGLFWNGTSFSSAKEVLFTAMGTTSWSLNFPIGNLADGTYVVHSVATDNLGDVESSGPTATFLIHRVAPAAIAVPVALVASPRATTDSALLFALAAFADVRSSASGAPFSDPTAVGQPSTIASFPGGRSPTEFRTQPGGGDQEELAEAARAGASIKDAVDGAFQLPLPDTTDGIWFYEQDAADADLSFWAPATAEGLPVEQGDPVFPEDGAPGPQTWAGVGARAEEPSASTAGASMANVVISDLAPGAAEDDHEWARGAALAAVALLLRQGLLRDGESPRQGHRRQASTSRPPSSR
jgi:hypothetical protein